MLKQIVFLAACAAVAMAQVNVGSITGTILDPSGAGVPAAKVILTNEETGVALETQSAASGSYLFGPLQRGVYRINVLAGGFRTTQRKGLLLQVGEKLGVNVTLELGSVNETVEVKAESPLLTTTNASVGQVINNQKIMELPLPGRDPSRLFQLAPGVGGVNGNLGDLRLGGGRTRLVEFYVDGSPTTSTADARATALPSIDAIEEVKVETNNLAAEYGRTSGGAINVQTRAGTNQFHGSAYLFEMGDFFNANDWNSNRRGFAKAGYNRHLFGGTIGGPVTIPKVYDGHNKTFFFFNYDAGREYQDGSTQTATVPTTLERSGDFSQSLNTAGQKVTIYDPRSYDAVTNSRKPFANNQIPTSQFDPVAKYLVNLWGTSNRAGDAGNGVNNYQGISSSQSFRNDFTGRLDQTIGSNHRVYLRITHKQSDNYPSYWAGPATSGVRPSWETQVGSTLNWNWTARPTLIVSAQFGAAPRDFIYYPVFENFDPTQIPFASNAKAQLDPRFIPLMSFEKISGLGVNFGTTWLHDRYFFGNVSATKIWNKHTFKVGYEQRRSYMNDIEAGAPSGGASFDGAWTGLNQTAALAQQGTGFASFLLGLPNNFTFDGDKLGWAVLFANHGLYLQDDYKVTPKLTLNLGLRWEFEAPETERYNRIIYTDPSKDSGIRPNASFDFNRDVIAKGTLPAGSPVPNLSSLLGGMGLAGTPGRPSRSGMNPYYKNYGPRLGFAYQLASKTVVRAGYGILYSGYTGNASGVNSVSLNNYLNATGAAVITTDGGKSISATLSNPFPNNVGLSPALTSEQDIMNKYVGNLVYGYDVNHRPSYEISYNVGLQQQLGGWLLEGSFVGNLGRQLYIGGNPFLGTLEPKYLSLGTLLDKQVANPFYGTTPAGNTSLLAQPTIAYKYLLINTPQYAGGLRSLQRNGGESSYTAAMFRVEKRLNNGLSVLVSYTVSKLIENTSAKTSTQYGLPQDGVTFSDLRGLSVQDIPQKLVMTYLYELPIGRGKRLMGNPQSMGARILDKAAGGWKVAGFTIMQSGYPLQIRQSDNYTGGLGYGNLRPTLAGNYHTSTSIADATGAPATGKPQYLNLAAFQVTGKFGVGTVPQVLPDMRQPRYNQTDLAIMKEFRFAERRFLQVRLESSNLFNHPLFQLDANAQNIQRSEFGYFQSQLNAPRNLQFGARFVF